MKRGTATENLLSLENELPQKMAYLNNAATSFPKPSSVIRALDQYIKEPPFLPGRSGFESGQADMIQDCREKLSNFFNAPSPDNIIFTSSATHALNLVLKGLMIKGGHIVTTQADHNSVLRLLKTMESQRIISLTLVKCDSRGKVDPLDILHSLTDNTKAVVINHCSNVTGWVQDIKTIGQIIKDHPAAFIVDGAQSAGAVDINVDTSSIDSLVFAGHKSLFGIQGIGGLYIGDSIYPEPLIIGGTGVKSDYLFQPRGKPGYYEAGTPNIPGIVSLNAGIAFIQQQGLGTIQKKKAALKRTALEFFLNSDAIIVYGGKCLEDFTHNEAVISFNIKGFSPDDTGYILEHSFGIVCRSGLHCAPLIHEAIGSYPKGCVRVSFSCFNDKNDVDRLINAVRNIIQNG